MLKNCNDKIAYTHLFNCYAVSTIVFYMSKFLNYFFGRSFAALFEIIHK